MKVNDKNVAKSLIKIKQELDYATNGKSDGIGLKNIKDTVYKYNGEIKIEFDDGKFVIKFIFSLKN